MVGKEFPLAILCVGFFWAVTQPTTKPVQPRSQRRNQVTFISDYGYHGWVSREWGSRCWKDKKSPNLSTLTEAGEGSEDENPQKESLHDEEGQDCHEGLPLWSYGGTARVVPPTSAH